MQSLTNDDTIVHINWLAGRLGKRDATQSDAYLAAAKQLAAGNPDPAVEVLHKRRKQCLSAISATSAQTEPGFPDQVTPKMTDELNRIALMLDRIAYDYGFERGWKDQAPERKKYLVAFWVADIKEYLRKRAQDYTCHFVGKNVSSVYSRAATQLALQYVRPAARLLRKELEQASGPSAVRLRRMLQLLVDVYGDKSVYGEWAEGDIATIREIDFFLALISGPPNASA